MKEIGIVISNPDAPSTRRLSFVVKKGEVVRRGQFVQIETEEGLMVGRVSDVIKTNRYFSRPESVERYESSQSMKDIFPVDNWEYLNAEVIPLGIYRKDENIFSDVSIPPSPGTKVFEVNPELLKRFLGMDENGLEIGDIPHHNVKVTLNITRLLQKHLAILAISGAGKSYLVSVLAEELLKRRKEDGQVGIVIVDVHGEYTLFASDPEYAGKVNIIEGKDIKIGLSKLSTQQISEFLPKLSNVQVRELSRFLHNLKEEKSHYSLEELIRLVESDGKIKSSTKDVLITILTDLMNTELFDLSDNPPVADIVKQGVLSIIDLSSFIDNRKKQMVVAHLAREMFNYRRENKIPPFLLILEEAHQFVPETARAENAISRGIIQTIAREGRKFHASLCLVSQRPIQLSTTALSQCNTHIILRVTNPYDLDHIGRSSEGITKDVLNQISGLRVGTGLIVGEAVNYPIFVRIRKRMSKESGKGIPLEEAAKRFAEESKRIIEDAKSFM